MNSGKKVLKVIGIILLVTIVVNLVSYGTMSLWNWIVPALFHGPVITLAQAFGLLILSRLLFGGWGRRGGCSGGWGGRGRWGRHDWKQKMKERYESMTPEQKEAFKAKFRSRCGQWGQDCDWDTKENESMH